MSLRKDTLVWDRDRLGIREWGALTAIQKANAVQIATMLRESYRRGYRDAFWNRPYDPDRLGLDKMRDEW